MTEIMSEYLLRIAHALLVALAGWLGIQVSALLKKYINTKIKQSVCRTAVQCVEQVFKDIHGPEKLAEAMAKASQILEEKGITISETELLQAALACRGYSVTVDGLWSKSLTEKVKAFQSSHNLTPVDGVVGPMTWACILYLS